MTSKKILKVIILGKGGYRSLFYILQCNTVNMYYYCNYNKDNKY